MVNENGRFDRVAIEGAIKLFIVRAPGCWGRGESIRDAITNCLSGEHGGARKTARLHMEAFAGDESLTITDDGTVRADRLLLYLGKI